MTLPWLYIVVSDNFEVKTMNIDDWMLLLERENQKLYCWFYMRGSSKHEWYTEWIMIGKSSSWIEMWYYLSQCWMLVGVSRADYRDSECWIGLSTLRIGERLAIYNTKRAHRIRIRFRVSFHDRRTRSIDDNNSIEMHTPTWHNDVGKIFGASETTRTRAGEEQSRKP